MKNIATLLMISVLSIIALPAFAQDNKVVVIPLNSYSGGPGNWKHVSVSSLGGIPRDSTVRTGVSSNCGDYGRYANVGINYDYLTVPIQLPDGATIVSFTGLMCDNHSGYLVEMILKRSDGHSIAQVITGVGETSSTTLEKTDTTILPGTEVVDNSRYSYYIYMGINGNAGSAVYPVSGSVALQ